MFPINPNEIGGTEYMGIHINENILPLLPKLNNYYQMILPGAIPYNVSEYIDLPKVIWLHNPFTQFTGADYRLFITQAFEPTVKYWVVPSNYLKQRLIDDGIKKEKIIVLNNGINPLNYNADKFDKPKTIKAVYLSSEERGLRSLLKSFNDLDESIELDIFTKWIDDGSGISVKNEPWANEILENPRINFYGKTKRSTVIKHIEKAHLFLYPAAFSETFCLAMVEAMSAGLYCVTSSEGALPEISNDYNKTFDWNKTLHQYIHNDDLMSVARFSNVSPNAYKKDIDAFVALTNQAVAEIKEGSFDPTKQIEFVNNKYSWETVKQSWLNWHETLPETPNI